LERRVHRFSLLSIGSYSKDKETTRGDQALAGAWWNKRVNKLRGQRANGRWSSGVAAIGQLQFRNRGQVVVLFGYGGDYRMADMCAIGSFADVRGALFGGWKTVRPGRHLTERSCRGMRAVVVLGAWQQIVKRNSTDHQAPRHPIFILARYSACLVILIIGPACALLKKIALALSTRRPAPTQSRAQPSTRIINAIVCYQRISN
jgi:hypothetical protein